MALQEVTKKRIEEFSKLIGVERGCALGPARLVDEMLAAEHNEELISQYGEPVRQAMRVLNKDIYDNRQEAEQYLAGLLGMF